ncbi:hypothetical protein KIW84_057553 [Lathyrus oleraceus]|uniref:Pentatricopeptide repeat-containing protein n=1 Tax=Pisum sativum TaxID=3888 RepID=A0A9D4X2J7_PEA|nr:hypothetical protein KIW84_057553 [Pisum sativum]
MTKNVFAYNSIIVGFVLSRLPQYGRFRRIRRFMGYYLKLGLELDVLVGSALIVRFEEALWMFRRMGENGMIPCKYAVTGVLSIFSVIGDFDNGRIVHGFVTKIGYGSKKDVASWNIMITGYGMHGYGDEALDIFFSYVSSPIGKLMEAYDLMLTMPFKADPVGWRALLAACCIHKDTDLAEIAASKVIEIKPDHCGNYVLMPNVYGVSLCSWPGCPPNTADKFAKLQLANIWATPFGIPLHSLFEAKGIAGNIVQAVAKNKC